MEFRDELRGVSSAISSGPATGQPRIRLVMLPGLDGTGTRFEPLIAALPQDIDVKVITYPTSPSASWPIEQYAQFAASELPVGPVVVFAESFSGLVALHLLALRRNDVKALILCGCFAEPPHPLLPAVTKLSALAPLIYVAPDFVLKLCCVGFRATRDQVQLLRNAVATVPPAVLVQRLRLVANTRCTLHEEPHIPCYYFQATRDLLVPARAAVWFKRHFARFQLFRMEGPHALIQTAAAECAQRVAEILKQTETQ